MISLTNCGKRYGRNWLFRKLNYQFDIGKVYGITGRNGRGKSTLLKALAGHVSFTEGDIAWNLSDQKMNVDDITLASSFAAPYLELIDAFSLKELLEFQNKFKSWKDGLTTADVIELSGLADKKDTLIQNYSSGMRQRVKLVTAICMDSKLLFLDEPTSNLDHEAGEWFNQLLDKYKANRMVIICSNSNAVELAQAEAELDLNEFVAIR